MRPASRSRGSRRAVLPVALLIALVQFLIEDQAVPAAVGELRAWGIGDYAPAERRAGASPGCAMATTSCAIAQLRCRQPASSTA